MRSPTALIEAIKNAMTQDSHFGEEGLKKQKPVLLVVDEVDGALGGGFGSTDGGSGGFRLVCDHLKRCIDSSNKSRKNQDANESDESAENADDSDAESPNRPKKAKAKSKGRKDSDFGFKRPIIFICNDLYSKALKPLRELTIQVKIPDSDP